jgi:hypothetical protein
MVAPLTLAVTEAPGSRLIASASMVATLLAVAPSPQSTESECPFTVMVAVPAS